MNEPLAVAVGGGGFILSFREIFQGRDLVIKSFCNLLLLLFVSKGEVQHSYLGSLFLRQSSLDIICLNMFHFTVFVKKYAVTSYFEIFTKVDKGSDNQRLILIIGCQKLKKIKSLIRNRPDVVLLRVKINFKKYNMFKRFGNKIS